MADYINALFIGLYLLAAHGLLMYFHSQYLSPKVLCCSLLCQCVSYESVWGICFLRTALNQCLTVWVQL